MWIKICGIRTADDAARTVAAGVDAVGLNFYEKSQRYVAPPLAADLRKQIPDTVSCVGVFVNASPEEIAQIAGSVGLTAVQFHGDESVDTICRFHDLCPRTELIRAYRFPAGDAGKATVDAVTRDVERLCQRGVLLKAILADAHVAGEYGGTGRRVDADLLAHRRTGWPPLILAGGLTPKTVAEAIVRVRPWGVDTASGVEAAPGRKSPEKVEQFVRAARAADTAETSE